MSVPKSNDHTGALTLKTVMLARAIMKAKAVLNFIAGFEKLICRLFTNTPSNEKPIKIAIKDEGKA